MSESKMHSLPFLIRARVEASNLVTFIAERNGEAVTSVRYTIGNAARRRQTAEQWGKDARLIGKIGRGPKARKVIEAIERELDAAELRAMQELDAKREAAASEAEEAEAIRLASQAIVRNGSNETNAETPSYRSALSGIQWAKATMNGVVWTQLTSFSAVIVADIVFDDGLETTRTFEIEACLCTPGAAVKRIRVPVARYPAMNWPLEELGPHGVVFPGLALKDHARAAIQILSGDVLRRHVYTHTGWRKIGDQFLYLHGDGAIGPDGPVSDVEVSLPGSLAAFRLPAPPVGERLHRAVQASLSLLGLATLLVMAPIVGAIYRAAIDAADFTLALFGPTGVFKTELAALMQQHFGADFSARNLPGSWSSTGNALESLAFICKDTIAVIDDFAPGGSSSDIARAHKDADRVLRAQGNNSGRARLRPDGELRAVRPPRGVIVTTGEDIPRGESLRARQFIIEIHHGDVDVGKLTQAQMDGSSGLLAECMTAFLMWVAPQRENLLGELKQEVSRFRTERTVGSHRRTSDIVAHLAFGLKVIYRFAVQVEIFTSVEADRMWSKAVEALHSGAGEQAEHLRAADPARRYVELIHSAIVAGEAHVLLPDGSSPTDPGRWGWQVTQEGSGYGPKWRPRGDCIGWLEGMNLYLEPPAAYRVAQKMASLSDGLPVSERTIRKRLAEGGWLASTEQERGKISIRRVLQGIRREVLHFAAERVMPEESAQPAQSDHDPRDETGASRAGA